MKNQTYFGILKKSETLNSIQVDSSVNGIILESRSPFWGYYDDYPGLHNNATYLYLPIENHQSFVELHGFILKARKTIPFYVDMAHASLLIDKKKHYAIRVRGFQQTAQIVEVQNVLIAAGIEFVKDDKFTSATSTTHITKYFELEKLHEGIWKDKIAENHAYIEVNKRYSLIEFRLALKRVKNNWQRYSFDAGLVIFCTEDTSIDAVRIYSDKIWDNNYIEEIQQLLKKYLNQ